MSSPPPAPAVRRGRPWLWLLGGLALVVAVVVVLNFVNAGRVLTRARLDAARELWRAANVASYNLTANVTGRTQGQYTLQVRRGAIVAATLEGMPWVGPDGQGVNHQARYWTVAYLFDEFLPRELENATKPNAPPCYLTVEFDSKLGYPRRFVRSGGAEGGGSTTAEFTVTPVADGAP